MSKLIFSVAVLLVLFTSSYAIEKCIIVSTEHCEIMQCCGPEFDECECLT